MRPYIILKEADADDLEAKVENYRERGYRPQGGVAISQWERAGAIFYYQVVCMPMDSTPVYTAGAEQEEAGG